MFPFRDERDPLCCPAGGPDAVRYIKAPLGPGKVIVGVAFSAFHPYARVGAVEAGPGTRAGPYRRTVANGRASRLPGIHMQNNFIEAWVLRLVDDVRGGRFVEDGPVEHLRLLVPVAKTPGARAAGWVGLHLGLFRPSPPSRPSMERSTRLRRWSSRVILCTFRRSAPRANSMFTRD